VVLLQQQQQRPLAPLGPGVGAFFVVWYVALVSMPACGVRCWVESAVATQQECWHSIRALESGNVWLWCQMVVQGV
jgi:hypothetical protein